MMMLRRMAFCVLLFSAAVVSAQQVAPKPLFRDPVYDGAADPVVIKKGKVWWMYYTNRRATEVELPGVSWVFGTAIGIAKSMNGVNWKYAGNAKFKDMPAFCGGDSATLWAPDVVLGNDGQYHMFLTNVPGIAEKWGLDAYICHYTSKDLKSWKFADRIVQAGDWVIDAEVIRIGEEWRLYYKGNRPYSHIGMVVSDDLYDWSEPKEVMKVRGEGPALVRWKDYYWMLVDTWKGQAVYRSKNGDDWDLQPGEPLLPDGEGTGMDDVPNALHANTLLGENDRLYLFYFTHPGRVGEDKKKDGYEQRRTSIQVVELQLDENGWLKADRNSPTIVDL